MLPAFRIRNLRRPPSPSGQQRGQSPPKGCYDAIVQITAPQYDRTVSTVPEATLKYVDEDQEVITVSHRTPHKPSTTDHIQIGSSLELIQRLNEPVAPSTKRPEPSQVSLEHKASPLATYSRASSSFSPRPGQEPSASHANNLLISHGIDPMQITETQFRAFQQQNPQVQLKSIRVYTQNVEQHQRAVKAALFTSRTDPTPQSREELMQQAKDLVARADHQTEAFRLQCSQQQPHTSLEKDYVHAFDLDSTSQRAFNVWCQIQSKMLMDMDMERAEKACKDAQSHSSPSQHGGLLEKLSDGPGNAASDLLDNRKGDQSLRLPQDERQYYFDITNPPQLNSEAATKPACQGGFGLGGQRLAKEPTPLLDLDQETNLTIEGRRQVCILPTEDMRAKAFLNFYIFRVTATID